MSLKFPRTGKGLSGEAYNNLARERLLHSTCEGPHVGLSEPCLDFTGCTGGTSDYGVFYLRPKQMVASRASYTLFVGDPGEKQVCHHCDRPICVRPSHLFLGTQQENENDKLAKGRTPRGESHYQGKLTEDLVRMIRASPEGATALGRSLGVSHSLISMVRSGKTWGHVL